MRTARATGSRHLTRARAPVGQTRGRGDPRDATAASEASPPCLAARSTPVAVAEDGVDGDVRTTPCGWHVTGAERARCRRHLKTDPLTAVKTDPLRILSSTARREEAGVVCGGLGRDPPAAPGRGDADQGDRQDDGCLEEHGEGGAGRVTGRRSICGRRRGRWSTRWSRGSGSCCRRCRRCRRR